MSPDELQKTVLRLGGENKTAELTKTLDGADDDTIKSMTVRSLRSNDGPTIYKHVMQGLVDASKDLENLRLEITETVVEEVITKSTLPNVTAKKMIDVIFCELDVFASASVMRILSVCMSHFDPSTEMLPRWLPLLAKLLTILDDMDQAVPDDGEVAEPGAEYKARMINDICDLRWASDNVTSIAAMFREVKMTNKEVELVFTKILDCLNDMSPQEVPPLVFQLLLLSRTHPSSSAALVTSLTSYFSRRLGDLGTGNETTNMDMDSINMIQRSNSIEDVQQAEGTVIFHLASAARMGHPVAKEVVKVVKNAMHAPEVILNPFSLFLSLSLTSVKLCSDQLLDSIKQTIGRYLAVEERRQASAWFRSVVPKSADIVNLLTQVITQSSKAGGWDLIGQGLVDLGLLMLDASPGVGPMTTKVRGLHHLGGRVLLKVIQKQPDTASSVLQPLGNRIQVHGKAPQYTEALRVIISSSATILMENPRVVTDLVEDLQSLSYMAARRTLMALLPLVKLSRALRDSVILVLRKALFSRQVATRRVAVTGVLLLLKTFRISTSMAVSQLSQSSGSLSQIVVDVHRGGKNTNEAMCLELLGVLKRCFGQQAEVRLTMYQGLQDVVSRNPELCEGTLELVYSHVIDMFGVDVEAPELNLERVVVDDDGGESVVVDPAGWFLHCVQLLVSKGQQLLEEGTEDTLDKLVKLLDGLVGRYSDATISDLGFEAGDNYNKGSMEGQKNCLKVEVLLTVFEALLEYVITHGGTEHVDKADKLLELQHNHAKLAALLSGGQGKKGKGKKDKGEKKDKEGEGKDGKDDDGAKKGKARNDKKKELNIPKHALSLKALAIMVKSLLEDRLPSNQEALELLRKDNSFSSYIMSVVAAKVDQVKAGAIVNGDEGTQSDVMFKNLVSLASALFQHSFVTNEPVASCLLPGVKCLLQLVSCLLAYFPRRRLILLDALQEASHEATEDNLNPVLKTLMKTVMKRVARLTDNAGEDDDTGAEVLAATVQVFTELFKQLGEGEELNEVRDWVKRYMSSYDCENRVILEPVVRLLFLSLTKVKVNNQLAQEAARQLHFITGDLDTSISLEKSSDLGFLTAATSDLVFSILSDHLDSSLDHVDTSIAWIKSLATVSSSVASSPPSVPPAELAMCQLLAKIANNMSELVKTRFDIGATLDAVLKILTKFYGTMDNLTKYWFLRLRQSKQSVTVAKFDKLVKVVNSNLTKNVYSLITYMEAKQREQEQAAREGRLAKNKGVDPAAAKAKVLRETRYIPNLILKIETLEKDLLKLGKRIGQDLCEGQKISISRDFRIKIDMLSQMEEESEEEEEEVTEVSTLADITNSGLSQPKREREEEEEVEEEVVTKKQKVNKLGRKSQKKASQ